jgi:ribosomal protein S12 methylthiotransferase
MYSPVAGAAANTLPDAVPEPIKEARHQRFMEVQARISAAKLARKLGRCLSVLVDEMTPTGEAVARSAADAPEIDGSVMIADGAELTVGEFAEVRVVAAGEHDLWAEPVNTLKRRRPPLKSSRYSARNASPK